MSSEVAVTGARAPKRARGKQRVAQLLQAAAELFAEKGYEAATMTEIAARAGAPIGSLYQFFPLKEAVADTLVQSYAALLAADLLELEAHAAAMTIVSLVGRLFSVLRRHPRERGVALPLVEARMDERTRRVTFRHMARKHIAAILRARAPALSTDDARDMAVMVLQLMKAANVLGDEDGLAHRAALQRELEELAVLYLERRMHGR